MEVITSVLMTEILVRAWPLQAKKEEHVEGRDIGGEGPQEAELCELG